MHRDRCRVPALWSLCVLLVLTIGMAGCGSPRIAFVYPAETVDFSLPNGLIPAVYIASISDLRPPEQRAGQGHFLHITYPKDDAWAVPATQVYAEALAQDLEQTGLVEVVGLHAQADYILAMDLLSLGCELQRSPAAFLISGAIGAAVGVAVGGASSHGLKVGAALALVGMATIPVPTANHAEAEVRLSLRDRQGNVVWQRSCLGEYDAKKSLTVTAREDQQLVDEHLTKAVKRANACLLGQLRQFLINGDQLVN